MITCGIDPAVVLFASIMLRKATERLPRELAQFAGSFNQRPLVEKTRALFAAFVGATPNDPAFTSQVLWRVTEGQVSLPNYASLGTTERMSKAFELDDALEPLKQLLSASPFPGRVIIDPSFDGGCLKVVGLGEVVEDEHMFQLVLCPGGISEAMLRFSFLHSERKTNEEVPLRQAGFRAAFINHTSVVLDLLRERPAAMMIGQARFGASEETSLAQIIYLWSLNNNLANDLGDFLNRSWSASFFRWSNFLVKQGPGAVMPQIARRFGS